MNSEYVQNLRYKLQKRYRRLNSADHTTFHFALKQFWGFLKSYPMVAGILEDMERRYAPGEAEAERIVNHREGLLFEDETENAGTSYFVIKKCVESDDQMKEIGIGTLYSSQGEYNELVDVFRSIFAEPFYEYIDEQLDDQRAILALLRRYKQKCEWFQRDKLFQLWQSDTIRGEKLLSLQLYEYLHDQGMDILIEPASVSGEVDLIAAQKTEDPLIADAKIFNPDKGKGKDYIARGFNQIYLYTLDYNEPFGYLIIFKTCEEDLRFALANKTQSTPFVMHNNKTVFLVTVDICPHETSASKRGLLKTVEITEQDLIRVVESKVRSSEQNSEI